MRQNRKLKIGTAIVLGVAIICLSIAYAALSKNLHITGTTNVKSSNWSIKNQSEPVTSHEGEGSGTAEASTLDGVTTISITANLKKPGDAFIVTIPIENEGDIDAHLSGIKGATSNISCDDDSNLDENDKNIVCKDAGNGKPGVKYTITYGGVEVTDGITGLDTQLKSQSMKDVLIRVEYDLDASKIPNNNVTVTLPIIEFTYQQGLTG